MADIYKIMKRLEKGDRLEENLSSFSRHMMSYGNRLSYSRFALNYPTFYEIYTEMQENGKDIPLVVSDAIRTLYHIVNKYMIEPFSEESLKEGIAEVEKLREETIAAMKLLMVYMDRYTIYEYILNRVEYRFKENTMKDSDDAFKTEILDYITMDKDRSIRQMKTVQVIEQLPMRMTSSKFFQILQDGLTVYIGSEKESVENLVDRIRTAAMMEEPDGMQSAYPSIYEKISRLSELDFKALTEEAYRDAANCLREISETLNSNIDLYMILQELTNDLFVILLSMPYAVVDLEERSNCQSIIRDVYQLMESHGAVTDQLMDQFKKIEGVQELCADRFHSGESKLDEILTSDSSILGHTGLEEEYRSLKKMSDLLSTSLYMELNDSKREVVLADKNYILQTYGTLSLELKEHLKRQPKMVTRAIMAKVIPLLPIFIRTYEELETYIELSLSSCSDLSEKTACIEIIKQMMAQ